MFQWAEKFLWRYSHKPINTKNGFDIFPQTEILINVEMTYKVYQSAMSNASPCCQGRMSELLWRCLFR